MKKKILALLLAVLMLLSVAPITPVFAVGEDTVPEGTLPDEPLNGETPAAPLTVEALYDALMAAETLDEFSALLSYNLENDESVQAFFGAFDEEKLDKLVEKSDALKAAFEAEEKVIERVEVDFSNIGPFMPAVRGPQKKMLKAGAKGAGGNEGNPAPNDGEGTTHDRLDNDDIETQKTVTKNDDGTYTLRLETYVTGQTVKKTIVEEIPTDIVLVLDQSGSMAESMTTYSYTEAYPTNHNGTYYIKDGDIPREVTWCSNCNSWTYGCSDGWFIFPYHNDGTKVTPKTSATDGAANHIQFYTRHEGDTVRRLDALIDAVTLFADNVTAKATATETGVNHRIAIVGFSDSSGYGYGNPKNTEILTVDTLTDSTLTTRDWIGYPDYWSYHFPNNNNSTFYFPEGDNKAKDGAQYGSITTTQYKNALRDMSTEVGQQNVSNAIKALSAYGYTNTLDGLTMAAEIFANNPIPTGEKRNRVVILFTDGDTDSSKTDVVNKAYDLKNTYGATVYSIGILENANGTPPITSGTSEANALLHRISSNYPDATAEDVLNRRGNYDHTEYTNGDLNPNLADGQSYYLSTDNAETLSTIFQQISSEIESGGSNVRLDESTVVKDVITPQFTIHTDASSVIAYSETFDGVTGEEDDAVMQWVKGDDDVSYTPTIVDNTVTVTGFDFATNYVGMDDTDGTLTPHGKKLVIEIIIDPQDGDVSAVLDNGWIPTNGNTSGIYGEEDDELIPFEEYEIPTVEPYKINVTHVKFDADGNKQSATAQESEIYALPDKNAPISVTGQEYAPTYKFVGWYSEEACTNLLSRNPEYSAKASSNGVIYYAKFVLDVANYTVKHVLVDPDGTETEKTADEQTLSGTIGETTKAVAKTYTNYTPRTIEQKTIAADGSTVVTVYYDRMLGTLTVGKTGMTDGETAVFKVTGKGLPADGLRIAVVNTGKVTVTNLWVGETYTVTEEDAWTWRYTADAASKTASLTETESNPAVSFANTQKTNKWLDAFHYVKNLFTGTASN